MPCSPSVPRSSKETLITLTRHLGQQKKQDAAPGETVKAHNETIANQYRESVKLMSSEDESDLASDFVDVDAA